LEVLKAEALLGLVSCAHGVARQGKTGVAGQLTDE